MKKILLLTVLSVFALFAGDLKGTKVSKNIIVKEKQAEYKTFFEQYAHILEAITRDPYEKSIEYNTRLERLSNDDNLTFSILFDNVKMQYIPDESTLILKDQFNDSKTWGADYIEFSGCKDFHPQKIQMPNKIYEIQGCRTIVDLKRDWWPNNTFSARKGVKYLYDSSHTEHIGSNAYGATAEITDYKMKYVFLVPENPTFFTRVETKRIDANVEYAKLNNKMKLKIIGQIIDPTKIQYGVDYESATITDPMSILTNYLSVKIKIDKASFIDSNGKEIEIDLN